MTIVIPETLMWVLIALMACNAVLGSIQIWLRYKLIMAAVQTDEDQGASMSNETPNLPCGHHHSMLIKSVESDYTACELCDIRSQRNDAIEMERMYRAENARLREEVEMLNVRHAAAMLHAQTHADEYNVLREDEKGLLQDIQRLTEEAFKRDEKLAIQSNANVGLMEELAEAKRELELSRAVAHLAKLGAEQAEARALEYKTEHAALLGTSQWQETEIADLRDDVKRLMQIASECEERALAAEKSHMDLIMQVARKWPKGRGLA